jgi:hypothetical protein
MEKSAKKPSSPIGLPAAELKAQRHLDNRAGASHTSRWSRTRAPGMLAGRSKVCSIMNNACEYEKEDTPGAVSAYGWEDFGCLSSATVPTSHSLHASKH